MFGPGTPLADACVAPILSMSEAAEHPHIKARGIFNKGPSGRPEDVSRVLARSFVFGSNEKLTR